MSVEEFLGINPDDHRALLHVEQEEGAAQLIEELRNLRIQLKIPQRTVAARMGRHQSVVSNIERLGSDPRWSSLRRYATALGAVIEYDVRCDAIDSKLAPLLGEVGQDEGDVAQDAIERAWVAR
ncbi:helix-turn-helix domain-containing protein [Cellulosimicrobium funkei]|uniref:helix-turn-helix domain-containing protein n=1 Tax=Cellulosimicrobium funkei TaxID=264251 RepID=UPI0036B542DD